MMVKIVPLAPIRVPVMRSNIEFVFMPINEVIKPDKELRSEIIMGISALPMERTKIKPVKDDNAIKVKSLISDECGKIMRFAIVSKRRSKLKYLSF